MGSFFSPPSENYNDLGGLQISTAERHIILPVGWHTARFEIKWETGPVKFFVLQECARDVIFGMNFLCKYGAAIDLESNTLTL